ncbi:DNA-formamidopyrimidine glycosylase family protein [Arthrobacter sp. ISL-30]|uniref:DNA-formamidopyrimidine glycosylase family protein n=1 Tax=Arthrobacter sp. ISL-30 TaxID=2819109 RepID=UPI001BE5EC42|nr:DNA-formamidopyrimidine glycosylase family protein [Arthrobacter sp. ISL-30]MBT2512044.1 Fpg/Nei family DNA glycosylase [Arthrobacter sp. ISL-30]
MPELPEVTALASFLDEHLAGAEVTKLQIGAFFALKTAEPPYTALTGRIVDSVWCRGKFVVISTVPDRQEDGPEDSRSNGNERLHLMFHLAKAGWVHYYDELPQTKLKSGKVLIDARVGFRKDGRELGFDLTEAGTWKRLAIYVVRSPEDVPAVAELGPEPLDSAFDLETFSKLLTHRQQIKGVLRNQKMIAGIGNAYSDEILHVAKLSPFALASSLEPEEVERLYAALRATLMDAIREASGKPPSELKDSKRSSMRVHGRTGEACPVCGDTVQEVSFSDSSLQYCPTCQTGGKLLADRRTSKFLK